MTTRTLLYIGYNFNTYTIIQTKLMTFEDKTCNLKLMTFEDKTHLKQFSTLSRISWAQSDQVKFDRWSFYAKMKLFWLDTITILKVWGNRCILMMMIVVKTLYTTTGSSSRSNSSNSSSSSSISSSSSRSNNSSSRSSSSNSSF